MIHGFFRFEAWASVIIFVGCLVAGEDDVFFCQAQLDLSLFSREEEELKIVFDFVEEGVEGFCVGLGEAGKETGFEGLRDFLSVAVVFDAERGEGDAFYAAVGWAYRNFYEA